MTISVKDVERIAVDLAMGLSKDELRVKIDTLEIEQVYETLKQETDEALANGWVFDFSMDSTEAPDFEPMKDLD
jgi:chaperonin GroEL (HSP60 family)